MFIKLAQKLPKWNNAEFNTTMHNLSDVDYGRNSYIQQAAFYPLLVVVILLIVPMLVCGIKILWNCCRRQSKTTEKSLCCDRNPLLATTTMCAVMLMLSKNALHATTHIRYFCLVC